MGRTLVLMAAMLVGGGVRVWGADEAALPGLQQVWHYKAEEVHGEPADLTDPVVVKGVVYFGDSTGKVRAADVGQDKGVWTANVPGIVYSVVVDNSQVYASGGKGLVALAKETGEVAWRLDAAGGTGNCVRDPGSEMIFVGGMDGVLYGLDRNSGEKKWTHSMMEEGVKSDANARVGGAARPTGISTDGTLVFQSIFDQSRVIACDAATGEQKWSFTAKGWIYDAAAFDDQRVFVGAQDGYLYCLEKVSGEVEWKFKTKSRIESSPLVMGELVIVPSCDGFLYAVKKGTGELVWKFETELNEKKKHSAIYSAPLLSRGLVWFAAGDGHVYGVDPVKGEAVVKFCPSAGSELYSSLSADEHYLFVTTRQRNGHNSVEGSPSGENGVFGFKLEGGE
ncbi:MAG TPA: PQQ-binding-like beta-propeller repeat protein [Phycisphaerae bacterium]|nr:PQQ-binding-like beta-propeller repeat protein [Phycisphaerae bacterium]